MHSLHLLPYYPQLKTHLNFLETSPPSTFVKPPHLGPLTPGLELLERHCLVRDKTRKNPVWDNWQLKLKLGYERLVDTLWQTAREFDVRGYGLVLREKLTTKWCDCGCSTDHLGEVCERTVRDDEEEAKKRAGKRAGKEREWDGRGSGVWSWGTKGEEDVWETSLDFGGVDPDECDGADDMSIGEMMEWRYIKAERAKERVGAIFFCCIHLEPLCQCRSHRAMKHSKNKTMSSQFDIIFMHTRLSLSCPIINSTSQPPILKLRSGPFLCCFQYTRVDINHSSSVGVPQNERARLR